MTREILDRKHFAAILRAFRAARAIKSYGRLDRFGRALITRDGQHFTFPMWTCRPAMNVQR